MTIFECWWQNLDFGYISELLVPDGYVQRERMSMIQTDKSVDNIYNLLPTYIFSSVDLAGQNCSIIPRNKRENAIHF